nr:TetR family transcriptional regulator [Mycolicibacterium sp. lyk4-40-TYG-92]
MPQCRPGYAASSTLRLKDLARRAERYERIVAAATTLAARGTFDCQIRTVAEAAGVAPSTVYRYFTSKDEILLACLLRWLREFSTSTMETGSGKFNCHQRVLELARKLTASMCATPGFTEAVIRPYVYAHGAAASTRAEMVREELIHIFCRAMSDGEPSPLHRSVAELFTDVWVTNIAAICQHRISIDDLLHRLALIVDALTQTDRHAESVGESHKATEVPDEKDVA